jgi:2-phosphosulfolactate phosphatase
MLKRSVAWYSQSEYENRFEWGLEGARKLASEADAVIVVDVLSFSTCVDVALSSGAEVIPFLFKDERAQAHAKSINAICASTKRSKMEFSLSPASLFKLKPGDRIVLPSPNGSTISFSIENSQVICGCLRNAEAVAAAAKKFGKNILVIAAGEQWEGGSLRPGLEDMVGAGAILSHLPGHHSPEALAAIRVFEAVRDDLRAALDMSSSGKELIERGFPEDNEVAAHLNVSEVAPVLRDKVFVDFSS